MVQVHSFADKASLAKAFGDYLVEAQNAALAQHEGVFSIAVSGGSLVPVLHDALAGRSDVVWANWHIYLSDERIVPPEDPDSNYGLLKTTLLDGLVTKPAAVHAIDHTLESAEEVAARYEAELKTDLGPELRFDLVLLGCGPDGHTCSLFPGHGLLKERTKLVASIVDSPKPPPKRVTLTLPVLEVATKIAFVAQGAGKAVILKDVFEHPEKQLPSTLVNQCGPPVTWFVDAPAVDGVKL